MLEKKTTENIIKTYRDYAGLTNMMVLEQQEQEFINIRSKVWVSQESLLEHGVQIECQTDGSNDPQKLEDGIFIPYRWLNNFNTMETKGFQVSKTNVLNNKLNEDE